MHPYDDIIALPHHVSAKRAGMTLTDRAAQFSPFAALTGYEAVIEETGRLTEVCTELTEGSKEELNRCLLVIQDRLEEQPPVSVTYFRPDDKKSGGAFLTVTGKVKKLDEYEGMLVFTDGQKIPIDRIYALKI